MKPSRFALFAVVAALALGACGGGSSKGAAPNANLLSSPSYEKAGPNPSKSARMVCEKEASEEIAGSLGINDTRVATPTWNRSQHLYSCTYVYPNGKIVLSVKEMSSEKETTAYFDGIRSKYGLTQQLTGLGQGAWVLKNNDVVVRKDYKVLLIDVEGIPKTFAASQSMSRSDVATSIGIVLLTCWNGQ